MQFHFYTKPQQPCANPARQPETPISSTQQGSGARAAPAVPHSASAFLALILPRNVSHHSQQNPPLLCPQPKADSSWSSPRALGSAMSRGGAHSLRITSAERNIHLDLQEHPHLLLQKSKFCLQFYSVQKKPQNKKSDLLLFHVKTEPTWGVGEIKKGCISIATVSYDNIEA